MNNIEELKAIIHKLHGAEATHRESVPIHEVFEGQTIWQGIVEVFDLKGHPKTDTAYAWSHDTDDPENPRRHVTVLHIDPALSPLKAVRAAIMQEYRNNASAEA
jgi:hypothetical protein